MAEARPILQKLKNKSRKTNMSFQLILQLFCQEEFLRRLSFSKHKESLILKGGLFLFALSNFDSRPTMDIDFLMRNRSNEENQMIEMVKDIIDVETGNSFITFDIKGVEPITEQKEYHGVRIKLIGLIDNTKAPFNIDFGIGDVVVPKPEVRQLSVQLEGFSKPEIMTYSLESTIAEKWDVIIDRMQMSSRMKDYYYIYYLANNYNFEGRKLQEAIFKTLQNRGRIYEKDTTDKVRLLSENQQILSRWNAFANKTLEKDLSFKTVLDHVLLFIDKPFNAIINENELFDYWEADKGMWINKKN